MIKKMAISLASLHLRIKRAGSHAADLRHQRGYIRRTAAIVAAVYPVQ